MKRPSECIPSLKWQIKQNHGLNALQEPLATIKSFKLKAENH